MSETRPLTGAARGSAVVGSTTPTDSRLPTRDDRAVVVTGASAGVGRAVAHAFARRGCRLGLLARDPSGLEATTRECLDLGGQAVVAPTDVADPAQVEAAADLVESRFGPIDVWVNDAMATVFAPVSEMTAEEFRRATEVTYLGAVYGTMAALRRMRPRNRGQIVQVGSALAYRAIPLQAAYCGAKFGLRGFTDSLRTELIHEHSRIWVTMVQLPAVDTPQFSWCRSKLGQHPQPVPPIYDPEVPAEAVYFASRTRRREVFCGGSTVAVILGNRLAPGLGDRYLGRTGYQSQQNGSLPYSPDRPDNLFSPVPGVAATRGRFTDISHQGSLQLWATMHRRLLTGVAAAALSGLVGVGVRR